MRTEQRPDGSLEFRHDGIAGVRPMLFAVIACVAAVALATLWGGSFASLGLVLAVGAFFAVLLYRSSADSRALFDPAAGTATIVHARAGRELERSQLALTEIDRVIVEAASRSGRPDNVLKLRPALVAGGRIVPLTFRTFVAGKAPLEAAAAIRRRLGHDEAHLLEDSVKALATLTGRTNPAVRIARLGLGMGRLAAARHVTKLRDAAD